MKLGILRMARGKSETRESDEHIVYREAKTRKISGRPKSLEFALAKLANTSSSEVLLPEKGEEKLDNHFALAEKARQKL